MSSPDFPATDSPVYLENPSFVSRMPRVRAAALLFLASPFGVIPTPATISVSALSPTVTNTTPQTGTPHIMAVSRTDYVENPIVILSANKRASAFLLFSQAAAPNNTQINVPIAFVSLSTLPPTKINTTDPMPLTLPPTYVESNTSYIRSSKWLDTQRWMILTQPTQGPFISVPTASVSVTALPPTENVGFLWLYMGPDDGWWYEEPVTWNPNINRKFLILSAPTTPPPIVISQPQPLSIALTTFAPNVVASGNGYNQTIGPAADVNITALPPIVIQINSAIISIPVAQIVMTANPPSLGAVSVPPLVITMSALPPSIVNTSPPTIWDATYRCVNAGLIIGQDQWVTNPFIPYGYVISQSPPTGTVVPQWTTVNFVVSFGPGATVQTLTVPIVMGQEAYQAEQQCVAAGMDINPRSYAYSSTVAPDYVIAQSVIAGITVNVGTPISMTVSIGSAPTTPTVTVP